MSKKSFGDFKRDYFRLSWDEFEEVSTVVPEEVDWAAMEQESIEFNKQATLKEVKPEEIGNL